MSEPDGFEPTGWWRVVGQDGKVYCETSDEQEARTNWLPGFFLDRQYAKREVEWRPVRPA